MTIQSASRKGVKMGGSEQLYQKSKAFLMFNGLPPGSQWPALGVTWPPLAAREHDFFFLLGDVVSPDKIH